MNEMQLFCMLSLDYIVAETACRALAFEGRLIWYVTTGLRDVEMSGFQVEFAVSKLRIPC